MTFQIANLTLDLSQPTTFTTANWIMPAVTAFDHLEFWSAVVNNHRVSSEAELVELIVDIARCNFGPKPERWPGVTLTITRHVRNNATAGTQVVTLQQGVTRVKQFKKGAKGDIWTWTSGCLATAGLYKELFMNNAAGLTACQTVPGNHNGYTQLMSTLKGTTEAHQTAAENAFDAFVAANGLTARDNDVTLRVKAAARQTIQSRTDDNCAMGFRNVYRLVTERPFNRVIADDPTR